jgi:hypothetical protein
LFRQKFEKRKPAWIALSPEVEGRSVLRRGKVVQDPVQLAQRKKAKVSRWRHKADIVPNLSAALFCRYSNCRHKNVNIRVTRHQNVDIQIKDRENVGIQIKDRQNADIQITDSQNVNIQIKDLQTGDIQIKDCQNA